ncbi:MAG TPA: LysE family translocator [Bordetella sp.]|uniref:LysE family translocator n=1 Tax=Bordetella sp. TaxID=28081 RepID=UPI002ED579F1
MPTASTLAMFCVACLALILSPGPNMAFVVSYGAAQGPRAGLAAALGLGVANLVYTALTVSGLVTVIYAWPPAFDLIRYAGAVYLLWLAYKALRQTGGLRHYRTVRRSCLAIGARAALNSLLNPKPMLFYVMFLPQFVEPARGHAALQIIVLGGVLTAISVILNGLLGTLSGSVRRLLPEASSAAGRFGSHALAAVFALLAIRLALLSRTT